MISVLFYASIITVVYLAIGFAFVVSAHYKDPADPSDRFDRVTAWLTVFFWPIGLVGSMFAAMREGWRARKRRKERSGHLPLMGRILAALPTQEKRRAKKAYAEAQEERKTLDQILQDTNGPAPLSYEGYTSGEEFTATWSMNVSD